MQDHCTTDCAPLCACGCGKPVEQGWKRGTKWNRFILGHNGRTSLADRFWCRVNKTDSCWLWTGAHQNNGYGNINGGKGVGTQTTHRVSWELHHGPIIGDLWVLHHCDNRSCVNPDHLFLGTRRDNILDMYNKGRNPDKAGEQSPRAKLTNTIVRAIRADHAAGQDIPSLAKAYGITKCHVRHIVIRRIWRHI